MKNIELIKTHAGCWIYIVFSQYYIFNRISWQTQFPQDKRKRYDVAGYMHWSVNWRNSNKLKGTISYLRKTIFLSGFSRDIYWPIREQMSVGKFFHSLYIVRHRQTVGNISEQLPSTLTNTKSFALRLLLIKENFAHAVMVAIDCHWEMQTVRFCGTDLKIADGKHCETTSVARRTSDRTTQNVKTI